MLSVAVLCKLTVGSMRKAASVYPNPSGATGRKPRCDRLQALTYRLVSWECRASPDSLQLRPPLRIVVADNRLVPDDPQIPLRLDCFAGDSDAADKLLCAVQLPINVDIARARVERLPLHRGREPAEVHGLDPAPVVRDDKRVAQVVTRFVGPDHALSADPLAKQEPVALHSGQFLERAADRGGLHTGLSSGLIHTLLLMSSDCASIIFRLSQ